MLKADREGVIVSLRDALARFHGGTVIQEGFAKGREPVKWSGGRCREGFAGFHAGVQGTGGGSGAGEVGGGCTHGAVDD